ncbi:PP2C family protein-serine/threonine phosphatase [Streptomyces triticisoli]|jgi:serine phosphatase RsbU (regulator of sigma subunit)|uniref:PP2C family protein-serine/threonine phosphatase n=1 Tax=Streptomyces triticisoli TaxID=2182797 RepID=UPI000DD54CFA|nr:GAF domain-containing SpoIIE family protein phosphatase [Streptomyces triticisoli]
MAAFGENGRPSGVDAFEELSAQVRQLSLERRRLHRLLQAVVAISADMDTRTVLRHLVEAGTDLIGACYGALGVLGEGGELTDLITTGVDAERLMAESGLPQGHGLLGHLIARRKPLRVDDIRADPRSVGFPPGHPVMTSLLGVPLTVRDVVYGNLYLADKKEGTPFTDADEALLTALASAASVSIENARLYGKLKRAAEQFQRRLLPVLPDLSPLRVEARYQPASDLPRLGGDWYDAVSLPDGTVLVVVGDVTGHDVEAAPQMGQIRNMLRVLAFDRCGPPSLIVDRLDRALTAFGDPPAATLLLARIEQRPGTGHAMCWTNAGHPPPLLVTADGTVHCLAPEAHGIPVGVDPALPRPDHTHPLPPGSTLLLFTDGLIERRDQDIDVGLRKLADHAAALATAPLGLLCDALVGRRDAYDDDVALLALRVPRLPV